MEEKKETTEKSSILQSKINTSVPLTDIFFMTLRHWPWILVSIAVCVGLAYYYLLRTPDVYTRSAEILIKDESKGKSSMGTAEDMASLGLVNSNTNIQNEMTTLRAKDLMKEVVKRLGLDVNYFIAGQFHNTVAYGSNLPVRVSLGGFPDESSASFVLKVSNTGVVTIDDVKLADSSSSKSYTGRLNQPISTPAGRITVTPTADYHEGQEVKLLISKIPLSAAAGSYNSRLTVSMSNDKSTVVKLTMADESTQRADDVLNTLIGVYNENWINDKNQIAISTSNFINDRLGVIEAELGNVDSDISSYKSANLVPDVNAASGMYMSQSQQLTDQLTALNNQLQMTKYLRSALAGDASRGQLLPANTGVDNTNLASLVTEYNSLQLDRNALIAKSSDKNPMVQELDQQLSAQRQAIMRTVDNEIVNLNTQIGAIQRTEAQTVSKIAANPTQAKYLLSVERQQKVKESLYLYLLQKREETEVSQAFTAYNTRVVNKPGASGVPPTPNRRNILSIAFIIGLVIPFGFTYVRETLNTKVRGRKDVENLTLPFLGEIPMYDQNRKKDRFGKSKTVHAMVVKAGKRDIINEAFRVLRTNLEFMRTPNNSADVVEVTSFNPGSGKSFITVNTAAALALKGQRVLVIDGDLRHGSASTYCNSPEKGISNYLSGAITNYSDVIVEDPNIPTLFFLPIGTVPPNPTELLESPRFGELIEKLRPDYDYIMIDCPPIEVVADAQIVDKYVDRTIFILRAGLLERTMLPQLEKIYEEKKYKNMSVILNGTSNAQGRYGYSHSYRYGYGYGYGYGYNYGSSDKKKK